MRKRPARDRQPAAKRWTKHVYTDGTFSYLSPWFGRRRRAPSQRKAEERRVRRWAQRATFRFVAVHNGTKAKRAARQASARKLSVGDVKSWVLIRVVGWPRKDTKKVRRSSTPSAKRPRLPNET